MQLKFWTEWEEHGAIEMLRRNSGSVLVWRWFDKISRLLHGDERFHYVIPTCRILIVLCPVIHFI